MNLIEAIKSGKTFYRTSKPEITYYSPRENAGYSYSLENVLACDYALIEEKRIFTKEELKTIFFNYKNSPLNAPCYIDNIWSKYGIEYK